MCGRYADFIAQREIEDAFAIATSAGDDRLLPFRYNIAPTTEALVVARAEGGDAGGQGANALRVARWGLVPAWAKDPAVGVRAFNARSETVADKPTFRSAFKTKRCLVPASGYYEWQKLPGGGKQPHFIAVADGAPLAFAGLYEHWGPPEQRLSTFTILTTAARDDMGDIHDRQPVMLGAAERDAWLAADSTPGDLFDVIASPAPELELRKVGTAVGNVRNQGPELLEAAH